MGKIKVKTKKEIQMMRDAGRLAAETLQLAGEMVKPGVSLNQLDQFVYDYTIKHKAIPAPLNYHGFPKSVCTSVNEVVTHGIPDDYILQEGDIINIDVTSKLNGYHGDTSRTFHVGTVTQEAAELVKAAHDAMWEGIKAIQNGGYYGHIGDAIQGFADEVGYSVVQDYCGHGTGRGFHEDPLVLHYRTGRKGDMIKPGHCFTIEPMLNIGTHKCITLEDEWTVITADGELSAQFEHTMGMTDNGLEIFTQLD